MGDREYDGLDREGGSLNDPSFEAKRRKGQQKVRQCQVNKVSGCQVVSPRTGWNSHTRRNKKRQKVNGQ